MNIYATDAAIETAIARVRKDGRAFQSLVHRVAFSILKRGHDTRDFTKGVQQFNSLVEAMPGAARANALREWIEAFAPVYYDPEAKAFAYQNMKGFTFDLPQAKQTPFWEFKPEPEYVPVDPLKVIENAVKKFEKDQKTLGKKSKVTKDQIAALRALLPAEEAVQH